MKKAVIGFPKPKIVKYSRARDRATTTFQLYIRLRDAVKTTGTLLRLVCFTCGKTVQSTGQGQGQAGHFIPGRKNSHIFDERNCHGQCTYCNIFLRGNPIAYFRKMQQVYGEDVIKELESLDHIVQPMQVYELLAIEADYKKKIEDLKKQFE